MTYKLRESTAKKDGQINQLLGVGNFSSNELEVLKSVKSWVGDSVSSGGPRLIFTPNSEIMVEASRDPEFRIVLNKADINIADGVGLVIASKLLYQKASGGVHPLTNSLPGVDMAHSLVMEAARQGWRVYFLGGIQPGVAQKAMQALQAEAGGLTTKISDKFVCESDSGPVLSQSKAKVSRSNEETIRKINKFRPDILLVAFGQKKQERWLVENGPRLRVKVAMVVGGAFDFWTGRVKRAPKWVNKAGFEWLYRLVQEPWRWRRQLKLIEFGWLVAKEAVLG